MGLWQAIASPEFALVFVWLIYNFVVMGVAVLAAIDQPECRLVDRFPLRTACKVTFGDRTYWGHTNDVSESGASLTLIAEEFIPRSSSVVLEFLEHNFSVEANVVKSRLNNDYSSLSLKFINSTTEQKRHIIDILYSNMTWWKRSRRLGGLDAFLAILSAFLQFKPVLSVYNRKSQP